jgi:ABC-type multidrug transport system permease subunit
MAKSLVDGPFLLVIPFILTLLYYFCVGLQLNLVKYILHAVTIILTANCGNAIGLWAAATFSKLDTAVAVLPMFLMPSMIFSGLFVNLDSLPKWISWLQWTSPMKYAFVALMNIELQGLSLPCTTSEGCVQTGEQVLASLGLANQGSIGVNMIAVGGIWLGMWALAYYGFVRVVHANRGSFTMVQPGV